MVMSKYSPDRLPLNKHITNLVNIHAGGGWGKTVKADRDFLCRNQLTLRDGKLTLLGMRILDKVSTPAPPVQYTPYEQRNWGWRGERDVHHVGWSSDGTIWFYRAGWNIFNPILNCLAVDFQLLMFGTPSQQL